MILLAFIHTDTETETASGDRIGALYAFWNITAKIYVFFWSGKIGLTPN